MTTIAVTMTVNPPVVPGGGIVTVYVQAIPSGEVSVATISIQATGPFTVAESIAVQGAGAQSVSRSYVIPVQAAPGFVDFAGTASGGGVTGHAQARITVLDTIAPVVSAVATSPDSGPRVAPGDTVRLIVSASDNNRLAWLGYRLTAPANAADSVAVGGAAGTRAFYVVPTRGWIGTARAAVFARDSSGNASTVETGTVAVVDAIRRPTQTVAVAAGIQDLAFDGTRAVLYLSQPDSQWVAVLPTATLTYQTPIRLFGSPAGLDLSVGGDSLVVALRRTAYLAIVNLSTRHTDTVRLNFNNILNRGPDNVRVMGNGKAIVTLTFDGSGGGGQVWEYDLAAGTQRQRTDAGTVTELVPLARAADRSRLVLLVDDGCCPEQGMIYTTASDSFGVKAGTVSRFFPTVSADATGAHFLMGEYLFDERLTAVATLTPPGYVHGPTAISPDGSTAYMATDFGYLKVSLPDGAVLERVLLRDTPTALRVFPDGDLLVAVMRNADSGARHLSLVKLQ